MNIKITKEGETLTAAIDGPLDIKTAPELSAALEGELQDVNEVSSWIWRRPATLLPPGLRCC